MFVLVIFGYWRTGRLNPAARPTSRMSRLTTLASTGRRMNGSVNAMGLKLGSLGRRRKRLRFVDANGSPGIELELPGGDDLLAHRKPEGDLDAILAHLTRAHEPPLGDQLRAGGLGRGRGAHAFAAARLRRGLGHIHAVAVKAIGHRRPG